MKFLPKLSPVYKKSNAPSPNTAAQTGILKSECRPHTGTFVITYYGIKIVNGTPRDLCHKMVNDAPLTVTPNWLFFIMYKGAAPPPPCVYFKQTSFTL